VSTPVLFVIVYPLVYLAIFLMIRIVLRRHYSRMVEAELAKVRRQHPEWLASQGVRTVDALSRRLLEQLSR
jgi:hypothetical protein